MTQSPWLQTEVAEHAAGHEKGARRRLSRLKRLSRSNPLHRADADA
jgi:hypothetical protein